MPSPPPRPSPTSSTPPSEAGSETSTLSDSFEELTTDGPSGARPTPSTGSAAATASGPATTAKINGLGLEAGIVTSSASNVVLSHGTELESGSGLGSGLETGTTTTQSPTWSSSSSLSSAGIASGSSSAPPTVAGSATTTTTSVPAVNVDATPQVAMNNAQGGVGSSPPYTTRKQQPARTLGTNQSNSAFSSLDASSSSPSGLTIPTPSGKPIASTSTATTVPTLNPASSLSAPPLLPSPQAAPAPPILTSSTPPPYPALHLLPLNETFVPKQISLYPPGQRIKIGRQTNAKTIPNGTNGYFDSKVLSRMHAEVWAEDGKVLIKDVKSSNGTFIDGQRLSPEAAESDVFELRTGVTVEFGIDIVSDDGKSIVHHKVSAKVLVVMNAEDAQASSREFNNWYRYIEQQPAQRRGMRQIGTGSLGGNSFMGGGGSAQHQNALNIDHFLGKLQTELAKSRETGSHLNEVSTTLNDVQDTLGGGVANAPLPPPGTSAALFSRGITNGQVNAQQQALAHQQHAQSITQLQNQLQETQLSLAGHVGKMKDLEGLLAEHEAMKREVGSLRRQMETDVGAVHLARSGSEGDTLPPSASERGGRESPIAAMLEAQDRADRERDQVHDDDEDDDDGDDDARSVVSVDTVIGGVSGRLNGRATSKRSQGDARREVELQEQNARLNARLDQLASELDEAIKLGQSLRSQQEQAATTIRKLEQLISGLEKKVERQTEAAINSSRAVPTGVAGVDEKKLGDRLESRWMGWKEMFEKSWEREKRDWQVEHDKLKVAVQEWEERRRASSSDEEEDAASVGRTADGSAAVAGAAAAGVAGTIAKIKSKKKAKRRRTNVAMPSSSSGADDVIRSKGLATSATSNLPPLSSLAKSSLSGSSGPNRLTTLAKSSHIDDVASDSDSTIGSRGTMHDATGEATIKRGQRSGVSEWVGGEKGGVEGATGRSATTPYGGGRRFGDQEGSGGVIIIQQKHVTSAVVVVVGVLTAMAVSLKLKE
ncbi:hypothetical protein MVLG_03754 [Microbotryum lychnidis-dioicae p1A1 Lamole]|uniref:FHA domain-containing protein n=1 Tax=Microbotryum lychnidis-dioicae (strain p1A1 Lamole / MvSl-1064) TaxID=683840 RepID=U5H960_USTV1|nr:hypothetical protein MVLG_03754 [Microbotryum lychnidis-dioicae p1A1 Lamole]|eukprot:KDE05942.1 hypothetical protein MVLG_03754 [Microbotryum lychnidis-dioicae p1A1 Lamole]